MTFDQAFAQLVAEGTLVEADRETFRHHYTVNAHQHGSWAMVRRLGQSAHQWRRLGIGSLGADSHGQPADRIMTLARERPPLQPGGDELAQTFHRQVAETARREGQGFWRALADITGDAALATHAPPPALDPAALSPAEAERDEQVRLASRVLAVSYLDAAAVVEADAELERAEADTGHADREWENTAYAMSVRPYGAGRDDDWQRDKRRAASAGIDVDEREWEAAAEEGRDLVHELAAAARTQRVQAAAAARDLLVDVCQRAEAHRREEAIETALRHRARGR